MTQKSDRRASSKSCTLEKSRYVRSRSFCSTSIRRFLSSCWTERVMGSITSLKRSSTFFRLSRIRGCDSAMSSFSPSWTNESREPRVSSEIAVLRSARYSSSFDDHLTQFIQIRGVGPSSENPS